MTFQELYDSVKKIGAEKKQIVVSVEIDEYGKGKGKILIPVGKNISIVSNIKVLIEQDEI